MFPMIKKRLKNLWLPAISGENWRRLAIKKSGKKDKKTFLFNKGAFALAFFVD